MVSIKHINCDVFDVIKTLKDEVIKISKIQTYKYVYLGILPIFFTNPLTISCFEIILNNMKIWIFIDFEILPLENKMVEICNFIHIMYTVHIIPRNKVSM